MYMWLCLTLATYARALCCVCRCPFSISHQSSYTPSAASPSGTPKTAPVFNAKRGVKMILDKILHGDGRDKVYHTYARDSSTIGTQRCVIFAALQCLLCMPGVLLRQRSNVLFTASCYTY